VRVQFDDVTFDAESRRLWVGDEEAHLSPKAFDLLALLIERRPRAVSKTEIHEHLWPGTHVSESSLPSLISEIRDAIGDQAREKRFIRTLHARGYAFEGPAAPTRSPAGQLEPGPVASGWLIGATDQIAQIALLTGENILGREGRGVILIKSSTVSRRHVRIVIDSKGVTIEDLGSKNGTYVNDRRLTGPTPVVEGDQVRIGSLLFTYRGSQPAGSTETLSSHSSRLRS
jgi:DNA-binding winged helix-turn-helix (wHTH) protein